MRDRAAVVRALRRHGGTIAGVVALGVVCSRVGGRPFVDALRVVDGTTVLAALGLGALTTVVSAWRWVLVARRAGLRLDLAGATADYYRAVFLNAVLPGGVLGDVHRAVRHGRDAGEMRRAAAAVIVERTAGQVVLVLATVLTVLVPGALPLTVPPDLVSLVLGSLVLLAVAAIAVRVYRAGADRAAADLQTAAGVGLASAVVIAGYVATFVVAARAAGVTAPTVRLVPLLLVALLAMALPLNVGGWGPREGVAVWTFGAAGLGAAQGLETSVVYGVCVLVASLPGAVVLVVRALPGLAQVAPPTGAGTTGAATVEVGAAAVAPVTVPVAAPAFAVTSSAPTALRDERPVPTAPVTPDTGPAVLPAGGPLRVPHPTRPLVVADLAPVAVADAVAG